MSAYYILKETKHASCEVVNDLFLINEINSNEYNCFVLFFWFPLLNNNQVDLTAR